jgi:hypothetical protein
MDSKAFVKLLTGAYQPHAIWIRAHFFCEEMLFKTMSGLYDGSTVTRVLLEVTGKGEATK